MGRFDIYSDNQLIDLLKRGNEQALQEIYLRFWRELIDLAFQRLKDVDESKDIVQELFVSLYLRRKDLNTNISLKLYLATALKYRILNYFRHKITKDRYAEIIRGESNSFEEQLPTDDHSKELSKKLREVIQELPDRCKEVFMLSKFEGLTHLQISEKLSISTSTVEKHIRKAMLIIKSKLGSNNTGLTILIGAMLTIACRDFF